MEHILKLILLIQIHSQESVPRNYIFFEWNDLLISIEVGVPLDP